MTFDRFEAFLKDAIGLDVLSIGSGAIDRAVRERSGACNSGDLDTYWVLLKESAAERQQLIETIVVPETWFFRDAAAFAALGHVARTRLTTVPNRPLRLLSAPCSTGEEPYSMAMALFDAGVERTNFAVDAVDVSLRAIECARAAQYRKNSFRGGDQAFRVRHFVADRVHESVRECVRFRQANLLDLDAFKDSPRYDVIFCRNLLIYFDRATQDRAVEVLAKLLAADGILFVGPSESGLLVSHQFESINWPMGFAFRHPSNSAKSRAPVVPPWSGQARATHSALATKKASGVAAQRVLANAPTRDVVQRVEQQRSSAAASSPADEVLQRAQELADRGDGAAARECCERLIRTAGPSAPAHYLLGLLHDAAGEIPRAIEHYRRVLYLDPHHHEALIHLAILVEDAGDVTAARRFYERAKRATARGTGT